MRSGARPSSTSPVSKSRTSAGSRSASVRRFRSASSAPTRSCASFFPHFPAAACERSPATSGHSVSELRRASQHVAATTFVWRASVLLLKQNAGVRTLDELDAWLQKPRSRAKPTRAYPMSPTKLTGIPNRPGVYRMLRGNGDVLYVGKATSLTKRVRSYFRARAPHAEHILEMLSQARELEWTVTGSALEAALEEADTIKLLSPPYNKALRAGERSIVFATSALDGVSETPEGKHRLGPLAGGESVESDRGAREGRRRHGSGGGVGGARVVRTRGVGIQVGLRVFLLRARHDVPARARSAVVAREPRRRRGRGRVPASRCNTTSAPSGGRPSAFKATWTTS